MCLSISQQSTLSETNEFHPTLLYNTSAATSSGYDAWILVDARDTFEEETDGAGDTADSVSPGARGEARRETDHLDSLISRL